MSVLSSASIIDAMARLSPKDATALASLAERVAMGYIISQSHFVQCVKRELGSADLVFRALLLLRGEQSAPNAIPDSQALVLHARSCGNNACKVNGCTETKSMLATVRAHTASCIAPHACSTCQRWLPRLALPVAVPIVPMNNHQMQICPPVINPAMPQYTMQQRVPPPPPPRIVAHLQQPAAPILAAKKVVAATKVVEPEVVKAHKVERVVTPVMEAAPVQQEEPSFFDAATLERSAAAARLAARAAAARAADTNTTNEEEEAAVPALMILACAGSVVSARSALNDISSRSPHGSPTNSPAASPQQERRKPNKRAKTSPSTGSSSAGRCSAPGKMRRGSAAPSGVRA